MAVRHDREHFIPLRVSDLTDALCTRAGPDGSPQPARTGETGPPRPARAAAAHVHAGYLAQIKRLKEAYAPFDPDSDTPPQREYSDPERALALAELFASVERVLAKANYTLLSREELEQVMRGASYWGVDMDVCWDCFDRAAVFVRGKGFGKRTRRPWYRAFRKEEVALRTFGRVVVVLKQRPHTRLGEEADTHNVFLKLFKDIPQMDVEMLLPGTKVNMPFQDRFMLGSSVASSVGYVGWKLSTMSLAGITGALFGGAGVLGLLTLYTPLALLVGYGYKTWASFAWQKQTYMLQLTQSLYYQNLDNNAGVLYRVMDEAEEQETREVLLAYFYLWRYAGAAGWTAAQLDDFVELDLERTLGTAVDFEIADALGKIVRAGVAVRTGDRYTALPVEAALEKMDDTWDRYDVSAPEMAGTT